MSSTPYWGEISLQSLGSERPHVLHGFRGSTRGWWEETRNPDGWRLAREKADGVLRRTDARMCSLEKGNLKTWRQHATARVWQETNLSSDFLSTAFNMKFASTLILSFKWSEAFLRFMGAQIQISQMAFWTTADNLSADIAIS